MKDAECLDLAKAIVDRLVYDRRRYRVHFIVSQSRDARLTMFVDMRQPVDGRMASANDDLPAELFSDGRKLVDAVKALLIKLVGDIEALDSVDGS